MKDLTVYELFRGYNDITIPPELAGSKLFNLTVSPVEVDEYSLLFLTEKVGMGSNSFDVTSLARQPSAIVVSKYQDISLCKCPQIRVGNVRAALSHALSNSYDIDYKRMKVIGVTGTNGKTTTATIIYSILRDCGYKVGFIGTGKIISDSTELSESTYCMTTPDPTLLYPSLARMSDDGCDYVVMEVSSHSIALGKVSPILFEYGIFTNLDNDHLDFHNSKEEYFKTKLHLFEACKTGLFNLDDEYSRKAAQLATCKKSTFGVIRRGDAYATEVVMNLTETTFFYREKDLIFQAKSHLPGPFNVYNAMAALRCVIDLGIKPCIAKRALEKIYAIDGRMEIIHGCITAVIDYAHTPIAFYNCIKTLKSHINGRQKLSIVFGCGGDRDRNKRPYFGKYAEMYADRIVVTEDNCRGEDFDSIVRDITREMSGEKHKVIRDREEAIRYAFESSHPGDVVAVVGKGHEKYKIVGTEYIPFDERKIIEDILAEMDGIYAGKA